jgi:hypothetical protein
MDGAAQFAEVRLRVDAEDPSDLALLHEAAAEVPGVRVEDTGEAGILPILAVILVGSGIAVVGAVAAWVRNRSKHGMIVDLRPDVPKDDLVRTDPDIPFGLIVVLLKDGKVEVQAKNPANDLVDLAKAIFEKLAEGVAKPLDTAAKAIAEAVGDKASVKTAATA